MTTGLTAEKLQAYFDKAMKEIEKSANKPDVAWVPIGIVRAAVRCGNIKMEELRADIRKAVEDKEIPNNAILEVIR